MLGLVEGQLLLKTAPFQVPWYAPLSHVWVQALPVVAMWLLGNAVFVSSELFVSRKHSDPIYHQMTSRPPA